MATEESNPELLTTEQAAKHVGQALSSFRALRTAAPPKGPPFIKISSKMYRYRRSDLDAWLRALTVTPAPR